MPGRLKGKKAFLTAAGEGIGRATALLFSREGAEVWASDVNPSALRALSGEDVAIRTLEVDVRSAEQINAAVEAVGVVDVLFNCAGFVHQGDILSCSEAQWHLSLEVNLTSMYRVCSSFLPGMIGAGRGSIINMSSVVSSVKGTTNRFAYGTTKAAVIGLTKAIAADYVTRGIRCKALCPGTIHTPSLSERVAAQVSANRDEDSIFAEFIRRQPVGRLGTPEEIAAAAAYLASEESSFLTGQILVIDGGWSI